MADTTNEIPRDDKGRFGKRTDEELQADMLAAVEANPGLLKSFINKVKSSPVLNHMAEKNGEALMLATKAKTGAIILGRVRENILRPMLQTTGYSSALDNQFICSGIDFGMGNLLMFLSEMAGNRLPEKYGPYAEWLGESAMLAAYTGTFAKVDVEGLVRKILTGDVMAMLDETFKAEKK